MQFVVLSSFALLAAVVAAPPAKKFAARFAYASATGSCQDFNEHVRDRGLRDPEGNTHLGTLGFTSCSFGASLEHEMRVKRAENDGPLCATTDLAGATFTSDEVVTIMRWEHGQANLSPQCHSELEKLDSAVRAHEAEHVVDCKVILKKATNKWTKSPRTLKVCAKPGEAISAEALVKRLKDTAQADIGAQIALMSRDMAYRTRDTHERIGYSITGIDCSKCP